MEKMTNDIIREIINQYALEVKKQFGSLLKAVILYGSCARGDYDNESDIDIMVLLDVKPEEIHDARKKMRAVANGLDLRYDCVLFATFQSYATFEYYKDTSVFYQNVESEGVLVG